jgi:hypothetical protein
MATTISSAALVPVSPVFTHAERLALAGASGISRRGAADQNLARVVALSTVRAG